MRIDLDAQILGYWLLRLKGLRLKKMKSEKLKPCPFCGGEAEIVKRHGITNDDIYAYAVCSVCGVSMRTIVIKANEIVVEKIAEFWNRRADNE